MWHWCKKKVIEVCDTLQCWSKIISSLLHFDFLTHLSVLFTMICTVQSFTNVPLLISCLCTLSTAYYYKVKPTWMVKACPWVIFREETQNVNWFVQCLTHTWKHTWLTVYIHWRSSSSICFRPTAQLILFYTSMLYFQCPSSIEFPLRFCCCQ